MADTKAAAAPTSHADAARSAVDHLNAALAALQQTYDHPHHAGRLINLEQRIVNVISAIEHMPEEEESRADYAKRLTDAYMARKLDTEFGSPLPDHADRLLTQELERMGR